MRLAHHESAGPGSSMRNCRSDAIGVNTVGGRNSAVASAKTPSIMETTAPQTAVFGPGPLLNVLVAHSWDCSFAKGVFSERTLHQPSFARFWNRSPPGLPSRTCKGAPPSSSLPSSTGAKPNRVASTATVALASASLLDTKTTCRCPATGGFVPSRYTGRRSCPLRVRAPPWQAKRVAPAR